MHCRFLCGDKIDGQEHAISGDNFLLKGCGEGVTYLGREGATPLVGGLARYGR
jgi:hypothetical protein